MKLRLRGWAGWAFVLCFGVAGGGRAQGPGDAGKFCLLRGVSPVPVVVEASAPETVRTVAGAFAFDVEKVTGKRPEVVGAVPARAAAIVIAGVIGQSPAIDRMRREGKLDTVAVEGKWESSVTAVVEQPMPGVKRALVIAGSDRRGAAFALFQVSRRLGVSPWNWWADVPVREHGPGCLDAAAVVTGPPSVQYRGIFFNDEDWGLRPWAAKGLDRALGNVGPRTYERVFELLLRLRANTLWPAMHPGTLAFNAVPENARLADRWGIVMGASHSEILLRNNVGEWDVKKDGPWNFQTNAARMTSYWDERLKANGRYDNFYTVGLRGLHDSGLEAKGTPEVKARLVEAAMATERGLLGRDVAPDVTKIPQVIWLYKESLDLYRVGMTVPPDVTLGWTDDNYGYIRQLPNAKEQARPGGSGLYYHVSYWGQPHDYLWLCTTPPALIGEELTKAFDHGVRRFWMLNVGDGKPAEIDMEYTLQLAWDEPAIAQQSQAEWLRGWAAEQFGPELAAGVADVLGRAYQLDFVRKPEFMGFNGYNDGINRTAFNPLAWGDQNQRRLAAWQALREDTARLAETVPAAARDAFFELVAYPIEGAAAMNAKMLWTDRGYLDATRGDAAAVAADGAAAKEAYDRIGTLTAAYNALGGGKWAGMMDAAPRDRQVFRMPQEATMADAATPLPASWGSGGGGTVDRVNATKVTRRSEGAAGEWRALPDLGITAGGSLVYGRPGVTPSAASDDAWVEYDMHASGVGDAVLTVHTLPTFPVDSDHKLRFGVSVDGGAVREVDASSTVNEVGAGSWARNVLRNDAPVALPLGRLAAGVHRVRLVYRDPGVVFEEVVLGEGDVAPGYPVPGLGR